MLARTHAAALFGANGKLISIECDITNGLPGFVVVGLGDKAVEESRERVRSAIKNSGLIIPPRRITLNLAPADLPKDGSGYDLALAVSILAASEQIDASSIHRSLFLGELALDGTIRPVRGALIASQLAQMHQLDRVFVASENAAEAGITCDAKVFPVRNLSELHGHLIGLQVLAPTTTPGKANRTNAHPVIDLSMIYGQSQAKRAIEIAAAGGHNILLSGPPGTGKTLLAKAIMGILPAPTLEEMIEITKLYSLAGYATEGVLQTRPFRAPHHTASNVALIGGGTKPRPGEISLSHGGVLFLDEVPEFPRDVIEVLRQPLEDGSITVARASGVATFPARFMLVATRNPCPCGYHGDPQISCECTLAAVAQYQRKLSGPFMDRIDLLVEVSRTDTEAIIKGQPSESSLIVAERVHKARETQNHRFNHSQVYDNAHMSNKELKKYCKLNNETLHIARQAMSSLGLSARSYTRTIKVARTIADLENAPTIELRHFTEALQYRPRSPLSKPVKQSAT